MQNGPKCPNRFNESCMSSVRQSFIHLEGAGVAVAALLHPQVAHAKRLLAEPLRPKQVRVALKHAHYVVVADLLQWPPWTSGSTTVPRTLTGWGVKGELFGKSLDQQLSRLVRVLTKNAELSTTSNRASSSNAASDVGWHIALVQWSLFEQAC